MQEYVIVTGIILKTQNVGESDRRVTILTNTRGKIGAFARGARKPTSRFAATTGPFCFGTFKLYEGRDSYNLAEAEIQNYFEDFRTDYVAACYAGYFAEIADYYCRENNDEREMMKLFYQSLRALGSESIPKALVRAIYELKSIVINGEYPGAPVECTDSARFALDYIRDSSIERLYTFVLTENVAKEVEEIADRYRNRLMEHRFKSLEILNALC